MLLASVSPMLILMFNISTIYFLFQVRDSNIRVIFHLSATIDYIYVSTRNKYTRREIASERNFN